MHLGATAKPVDIPPEAGRRQAPPCGASRTPLFQNRGLTPLKSGAHANRDSMSIIGPSPAVPSLQFAENRPMRCMCPVRPAIHAVIRADQGRYASSPTLTEFPQRTSATTAPSQAIGSGQYPCPQQRSSTQSLL